MAIEKLSEFAKDGQKDTDHLVLTDGFSVSRKPARQWFNWLFNALTLKINEIIDGKIDGSSIVDNLTTDDAAKPVSAKQAKDLQDNKLGKTENAVSAAKLQTARTISFSGAAAGSVNYDGSGNSSCILTLANSGVVATTYGSSLKIPVLTVNAKGLITGVSEQQIPIVDDLTTGGSAKLLSAEQGKVLNDRLVGFKQPVDVTSLRIRGTTYTNTDIYPRLISINLNNTEGGSTSSRIIVDDVIWGQCSNNISYGQLKQLFAIVRPGGKYRLDSPNVSVQTWIEA